MQAINSRSGGAARGAAASGGSVLGVVSDELEGGAEGTEEAGLRPRVLSVQLQCLGVRVVSVTGGGVVLSEDTDTGSIL